MRLGLYRPGSESNGWTESAYCYYAIHTHDASGMIHIESASSASLSSSLYTLGHVLDVWGERLTSTRFGPYSGVVHIFTARTPFGQTLTGPWTAYTGTTPRSIPLYSHTAIWIEIGANYVPASRLPQIYFYTQY